MGLPGILFALLFLIFFAYRGWSILLLAPLAAMLAALTAGQPVLAHWTLTFMHSAGDFVARFFPQFLLGAVFGKLMDDSGSLQTIAQFMTRKLGPQRAILAVVLSGAIVTYGSVNVIISYFVLVPMAHTIFKAGNIAHRLMPAAIVLGTSTFTMTALPGTPSIQNTIPAPYFGTTPFAAPGLGLIASAIMLSFGLWWLRRAEHKARSQGIGYVTSNSMPHEAAAEDLMVRERATTAHEFDPAELHRGSHSVTLPNIVLAVLPLLTVLLVNFLMNLLILPRLDTSYLNDPAWGHASMSALGGIWAVLTGLSAGLICLLLLGFKRLPSLRESVDAGANAAALPVLSVASLVGFGSVVASLPAFTSVRDWLLSVPGGPLVSLAISINTLAGLTGSASGGLTIALQTLAPTFNQLSAGLNIDPALMHRVAVIGAGTLDSLPHNGAVISVLALSGTKHHESYKDIVVVAIIGPMAALVTVIMLGSVFGAF